MWTLIRSFLLAAAVAALLPCPASAEGWKLSLTDTPDIPSRFLAVDKKSQTFFVFTKESPLKAARELACTTGQNSGDKRVEGDLRTPEGVYFVRHRRTDNLDYTLYGDLAFPLNYPNPVDRLKGKTGSGIWVHGRGKQLVPRDTKGCVALENPDIHSLDDTVARGTPIILTAELEWPGDDEQAAAEAAKVKERTFSWASAWQNKAPEFLDYYDADKFSRTFRTPFTQFASRKKRIFRVQPWIQVMLTDYTSLPGPDYWVTAFGQFYRTRDLISQVYKRLYWQKNEAGEWVIVGRETAPWPGDMTPAYLERAAREAETLLENWRAAWERADLEAYASFYAVRARQDGRQGLEAIVRHKKEVWEKARPSRIELSGLSVKLHREGLEVTFGQDYHAANGYSDSGNKRIILRPNGDSWTIAQETWSQN